MKKFLFAIIGLVFVLSACGSSESGSNGQLNHYAANTFEIDYPAGWSARNQAQLIEEGAPEETLALFRSQQEVGGIFPTIAIVSEKVSVNFTSLYYAQVNIENTSKALSNFQTISNEEVDINDEKTILYIFSGRTDPNNADMQYAQTYFVKDGVAVTVTTIFPLSAEETYKQLLISSIKTFRFK